MKHTYRFLFLLIWGVLISIESIMEFFHPTSTFELFRTHLVMIIMLIVGLMYILSFIIMNSEKRHVHRWKIFVLITLLLNICYYLLALIVLFINKSPPIPALITGFVIIIWLVRYGYIIMKQ